MLGSIVQTEDVVDGFKLLGVELRWLSVEELARYNAELEPDRSPTSKGGGGWGGRLTLGIRVAEIRLNLGGTVLPAVEVVGPSVPHPEIHP